MKDKGNQCFVKEVSASKLNFRASILIKQIIFTENRGFAIMLTYDHSDDTMFFGFSSLQKGFSCKAKLPGNRLVPKTRVVLGQHKHRIKNVTWRGSTVCSTKTPLLKCYVELARKQSGGKQP